MQVLHSDAVLDYGQLRSVTLEDEELMREIVAALIEDTERQIGKLEGAIQSADSDGARSLAHYSKGACANVGAWAAASLLQRIEWSAQQGDFACCSRSLAALADQVDKLRVEAAALQP